MLKEYSVMDTRNLTNDKANQITPEDAERLREQLILLDSIQLQKNEVIKNITILLRHDEKAISEMGIKTGMGEEEEMSSRQKLEQEIESLSNKLETQARHYNFLLNQKDKFYTEHVHQVEQIYKNSWKWRIGNVIIESFIRVLNFFKNPIRFFSQAEYRSMYKGFNNRGQQADLIQSARNGTQEDDKKTGSNRTPSPSRRKPLPVRRIDNKPVIAVIMDEFTTACFKPECTMITFRPDNWKEKLELQTPEAIFVESAWSGNQGSWQYKIAKYKQNMGDEVTELITWAKKRRIPSVFWNKEDPPNFDRFIDKASLFDYVFTSDEDCIPRYKNHIRHNRIFSLPFAAQPAIHNPIGKAPRLNNVCFAGTYHADEYLDRQNDMEIILNPSRDYGLHIYDRNFGDAGKGSEQFRFPGKYQPFIKGRLNYPEMVKAYHQYKVFLNVNSVRESPTMFSRRVFELLAVGTPVISTYSKGIVELLGDTVFITESETDTRRHLDLLLNDRMAWMKASVRGIRKVMESHTYDKRLEQVLSRVGIEYKPASLPLISLLVRIGCYDNLSPLAETILKQTYRPKNIILLSEKELDNEIVKQFSERLAPTRVLNMVTLQDHLGNRILESAPAGYYAFWDINNWYGADYLKDYALAVNYSKASCLGKSNHFVFGNEKIREENNEKHFILSDRVPISTLLVKNSRLLSVDMKLINDPDGMYRSFGSDIFSADPLNFVKNGAATNIPGDIKMETFVG